MKYYVFYRFLDNSYGQYGNVCDTLEEAKLRATACMVVKDCKEVFVFRHESTAYRNVSVEFVDYT